MIFFSETAEWKGEMPESFPVDSFGENGRELEAGLSSWSQTEGVRFPPKLKAGLSLRQSPYFLFCFLFNAKEDMVLIFKDLREREMETKGATESSYMPQNIKIIKRLKWGAVGCRGRQVMRKAPILFRSCSPGLVSEVHHQCIACLNAQIQDNIFETRVILFAGVLRRTLGRVQTQTAVDTSAVPWSPCYVKRMGNRWKPCSKEEHSLGFSALLLGKRAHESHRCSFPAVSPQQEQT